jgi:hypothetical protein
MPNETSPRADVRSIDGIMSALYKCLSGPAGADRDWDLLRYLLAPGAQLIPLVPQPDGRSRPDRHDVESYRRSRAPYFATHSFYESEVERRAEIWGSIASVMSAYESRVAPEAAPFARGINSIQLVWDDGRWWIVSILWEQSVDVEEPAAR